MIVIKSIDIETFPNERRFVELPVFPYIEDGSPIDVSIANEFVNVDHVLPIKYTRPDGREILIACSKQAQEIIGILYDNWHSLQDRLNRTSESNITLTGEVTVLEAQLKQKDIQLDNILNANIFKRIKWLFTGIPNNKPMTKV